VHGNIIKIDSSENGFSVVELLITLIVGALFIMAFYQIYVVVIQGNAIAKQEATASDIAYSNLQRYTTRPTFTCDSNTNLLANTNAPGQIISKVTTQDPPHLNGPLVETVKVYAPRGCDTAYPVKIESIAEYGSPARKVIHSTYVN
jgi:prepilin-type N-terminal cleavage/methylation domain-containing protein